MADGTCDECGYPFTDEHPRCGFSVGTGGTRRFHSVRSCFVLTKADRDRLREALERERAATMKTEGRT